MSSRSCLVSFILNFLVSIRLSKISLKNYFRQMIFYVDFFFLVSKVLSNFRIKFFICYFEHCSVYKIFQGK